jgi:hypothetical protein
MRAHNAVPGGSGLLAETALVREAGGYDGWFTGCEDYELAVRLALAAPVATVDRPLVGYRIWPTSMSSNVAYMRQGHRRVLDRWRGDLGAADVLVGDTEEHRYFASLMLRNGDRLGSAREFVALAACERRPRRLFTAVLGALAPARLADRHARAAADEVPEQWRAEAHRWLRGPAIIA